MKKFLFIFFTGFLFACTVEENTPDAPANEMFDPAKATLIKKGTLEGAGGHTASGVASLYLFNGRHVVYLDPYESQNGPDLKVYLSKDEGASEYLRLGKLKSTMGAQSYEVPVTIDEQDYPFVHIWCEKYSVVFAVAAIQ